MKIVHISDLHFGHTVNGIERDEEFKEFIAFFEHKIEKIKPDAVVVAGDIFDVYFPSANAIKIYYDFLLSLRGKTSKVIITGGNHDSPRTLQAPKEILKYLDVVVVSGNEDDFVEVVEFDDFVIVAFSFIRDAILRKIDSDFQKALYKIYQEKLSEVKARYPGKKVVATGHLSVNGAKLAQSEREIYIGNIEFVSKDIFSGYDLVLLGHIHNYQQVDSNVFYCGSPVQIGFGEKKEKVFLIHENGKTEKVKIPQSRDFVKLGGKFEKVYAKLCDLKNAYVEIELTEVVDAEKIKLLKNTDNFVVKILQPYLREIKKSRSIKKIDSVEIVKDMFEDEEIIELFLEIKREVEDEFGKVDN